MVERSPVTRPDGAPSKANGGGAAPPIDAAPKPADGGGDLVMDKQEYDRVEGGDGPVPRLSMAPDKRMIFDRFRDCFTDLFAFGDICYGEAVDVEFGVFQSHILEVSHRMSETVDWGTLDPETQESLKAWAPKAKEYLETPRGAEVIFESWLWRTLVEGVFNGPGDQPPWKSYTELLRIIGPLASLPLDALRWDQKETNHANESWRPIVADRLKTRSLLWRALTMELLKSARGETPRYAVESVVSLLTGKFGRWFQPIKDGRRPWPRMDKHINGLATAAVELDLYLHRFKMAWEFSFTDRETGRAHGFLYKKGIDIKPHIISSDTRFQEGYPVDLIVRPSFRLWGDYEYPVSSWSTPCFKAPMEVAIDMLLDDVDIDNKAA